MRDANSPEAPTPDREIAPKVSQQHKQPSTEPEYHCDLCGAAMQEWHCRIICNACGYQRDCSDP